MDRRKLAAHRANRNHFIALPVDYVQLDAIRTVDASDFLSLPFIKRFGFRDELECRRLGYAVEQQPTKSIPLIPDLVQRVIFSPFTHPNIVAA